LDRLSIRGEASDDAFKFDKVDLKLLDEIQLLDERFEKDGLVYHEPTLDAYISRIGNAFVADKKLENVTWKFRVLRDPSPNAFAMPNGSIYINTGMLSLLDDEAQLAGILAHEVIHVSERHTYIQNRSIRKKVLAVNILNTISNWNPLGGPAGLAISLVASISPFFLDLSVFGYSRELEKQADLEGLAMMSKAGYAPEAMVNSFKVLQKDIEGEIINTFYSDHPKLQERVSYLTTGIDPNAKKLTEEEEKVARIDYLTKMEMVNRHNIYLALNEGRYRSAAYASRKLVDFNPKSSANVFYLAESFRLLGPRLPELNAREQTSGAKKKAAKKREKRTVEELDAELMNTPAGKEAWELNQELAERLYNQALELDRFNAAAHRGLGMLYEKLERKEVAAREYSKYLELAPNAIDSERIRRRLSLLREATESSKTVSPQ
jgi:predicted Zn-dependent protease